MSPQDAWIAATALALDAPLATNNRRDFEQRHAVPDASRQPIETLNEDPVDLPPPHQSEQAITVERVPRPDPLRTGENTRNANTTECLGYGDGGNARWRQLQQGENVSKTGIGSNRP